MPNSTLYVIPETHTNKQDQELKSALVDLASWGAINVLLESVLLHDTSGQSVNLYGIEEEASIKRANLVLHHIQNIVQTVLGNANNPRVFALSIGAKHIDSSTLAPTPHYQGKKDLPTILGNNIVAGTQTVDVLYGNQSVATIAAKALELSDNLSWSKKWPAQVRLKLYVGFGI